MTLFRFLRKLLDRTLFNPRDWITWALLFMITFVILHLLGWRDATSIISGTFSTTASPQFTFFQGALYTLVWFATILVAPILLLAAAIHLLLTRLFPKRDVTREPVVTESTETSEK